jgi:transposase
MSVQQRRKYNVDFKRNAVLLSEDPGRTAGEVAGNLGIAKDILYRWRREHRARERLAFPEHGCESLTHQEQKIRELEKKLKDVQMEQDIF